VTCGSYLGLALALSVVPACGRIGFATQADALVGDAEPPIDGAPQSQLLRVSAAGDNGTIYTSSIAPGCSFGHFHAGASLGTPVWAYLRFELAQALPAVVTIERVSLVVRGFDAQHDPARHYLVIAAEDSADAPTTSSFDDRPHVPTGRLLLEPSVRWPESGGLSWTLGADNQAPDLAPILQALVARHGGLASGAHIQLWSSMVEPNAYTDVGFGGYCDETSDQGARLDISWLVP
jgi:hypothetical protein